MNNGIYIGIVLVALCAPTANAQLYVGSGATVANGGDLYVQGPLHNDGNISGDGITILNGATAQAISGTGTFSNLELDNSAGASIAGTTSITDTYTPSDGVLAINGAMVLKSDASGTARIAAGDGNGGYISGSVTMERYVPGKRAFRFLGHPFISGLGMSELTDDIDITGAGGSPFTATATNNPSAFYFDVNAGDNSTGGNNPGWVAYTASSTWDAGQVMRVLVRGEKGQGITTTNYTPVATTIDITGAVNQGDKTVNLAKGSSTDFVLVSNPFPSQVDMDAISRSNVGSAFYIWDAAQGVKGGYTSYSFGSSSFILPSCGAFVTTLSASGSVTFEEADKVSNTPAAVFKKTGVQKMVGLRLEDSTIFWDRLLLRFDDNTMATVDYDDAPKLYNPDMSFYTWSKDDSMLSIDVRPYAANEAIPLGLYATRKQNFRIVAKEADMPAGTKLFLHDKYLNKAQEVTPGFEYWFAVDSNAASWGDKRFELNTQGTPSGIIASDAINSKVKIAPNPATEQVIVFVEGANGNDVVISLTNSMGVQVAKYHTTTDRLAIPLASLPGGIYIVTVACEGKSETQKLVKQ